MNYFKERPRKKLNPKRLQREVKKQIAQNGTGTKSQQALKLQHEQKKQKRRDRFGKALEAKKQFQFELKQQKRKEKHKGRWLPFLFALFAGHLSFMLRDYLGGTMKLHEDKYSFLDIIELNADKLCKIDRTVMKKKLLPPTANLLTAPVQPLSGQHNFLIRASLPPALF